MFVGHLALAFAAKPAALWSFVLITSVMWAAGPWGPPPANTPQLGLFALIGWITIPWTAIADRYFAQEHASA